MQKRPKAVTEKKVHPLTIEPPSRMKKTWPASSDINFGKSWRTHRSQCSNRNDRVIQRSSWEEPVRRESPSMVKWCRSVEGSAGEG